MGAVSSRDEFVIPRLVENVPPRRLPKRTRPSTEERMNLLKKVQVRNLVKVKRTPPPEDARILKFQNASTGEPFCWKLSESYKTVTQRLSISPSERFFEGSTFRVFFPMGEDHYITKMHRSGTPSVDTVFQAIHKTAIGAAAIQRQKNGLSTTTYGEAMKQLRSETICSVIVRTKGANHIYIVKGT